MQTGHEDVWVTSNSVKVLQVIYKYFPDHLNSIRKHQKIQIIPIFFLPPSGSCRYFNPSASLHSTASPRSLRSSLSEMPYETRSFGQAPLETQCHAAAGILEHQSKSTTSSPCEWPRASSRSAAPSPWSSKHLQCWSKVKSYNNFPKERLTLTLELGEMFQTR